MRARKMLTSPALLSMVSSRSASTRAISTRSTGALSRPGNTGALLNSRLAIESSLAAMEPDCETERERRASTDSAKSAAAAFAAAATGAGGAGAVDRQHEGLEFMTKMAHRADARQSGAAFEGMQLTLQFRDSLFVLAVAIPGGQRAFSCLQQFGRLFAVDVGDFVIELLRRRRRSEFLRNRRKSGDHGRRARVDVLPGNRRVAFGFDVMQPREQRGLFREKCRRLVDVRYHVVDRANGVRQSRKPPIRQCMAAVEELAHERIQGLGDADDVPRFGHLRAAAQGMDGAIDGLR